MANTKDYRRKHELTQKEFSKIFKVPLRTIENWDYRNSMPEYYLYLVEQITLYNGGGWLYDKKGNATMDT